MKNSDISEYITSLNVRAMKFLKLGNPFSANKLLQKALKSLTSFPLLINLHTVTLNNLGCYYKWIKKPKLALKYFEKSVAFQKDSTPDPISISGTYLNISSLHSDLGNHNLALQYASDSLKLLKDSHLTTDKALITLSMAYHSLGTENLFIKNIQDASDNFELALSTAKRAPNAYKLVDFMDSALKDFERKCKKPEKPDTAGYYKLPSVSKSSHRNKSTPSPPLPGQPRCRFLTGDRLKPMFQRNSHIYAETPRVTKTLEGIQKKIDFLQSKLNTFYNNVQPLKDIEDHAEPDENFSQRSLEKLEGYRAETAAARKIQRFVRRKANEL